MSRVRKYNTGGKENTVQKINSLINEGIQPRFGKSWGTLTQNNHTDICFSPSTVNTVIGILWEILKMFGGANRDCVSRMKHSHF